MPDYVAIDYHQSPIAISSIPKFGTFLLRPAGMAIVTGTERFRILFTGYLSDWVFGRLHR